MCASGGGRSPQAAAGVGPRLGKLHPDGWLLTSPRRGVTLPMPSFFFRLSPAPSTQRVLSGDGFEVEGPEFGLPCRAEGRNCHLHLGSSEPGNGPGTLSAPVTRGRKEGAACAWSEPWVRDSGGPPSRTGRRVGWDRPSERAHVSVLPMHPLPLPQGSGAVT